MYLNPLRFIACLASLALGGFCFLNVLINDIKDGITKMKSTKDLVKDKSRMYKALIDFISAHSDLKQLSSGSTLLNQFYFKTIQKQLDDYLHLLSFLRLISELSYLYETSFTAVFAGCTLMICMSMLTIQFELVECFQIEIHWLHHMKNV